MLAQIAFIVALSAGVVQGSNLRMQEAALASASTQRQPIIREIMETTEGERQHNSMKGKPKRELMDFISAFRAEVCAQLKGEHGRRFDSFKECKQFMEKACKPGKDMTMDRDKTEVTSGKGYCKEYFNEKKAEEELKKQVGEKEAEEMIKKAEEADMAAAPAPAPATPPHGLAAPGPAPATGAPAPAPATTTLAPAPAPAPVTEAPVAEAPAPAAEVPAPATPEKKVDKKEEKKGEQNQDKKPEDDEAWYNKDGGKSIGRMHMDEKMKLPSQGYWGKLVEHEDGETATEDWGSEFGPRSGHGSYGAICHKNPDNAWCRKHYPHHSSAYAGSTLILGLTMPAVAYILGTA